jgi:hypothetical protein
MTKTLQTVTQYLLRSSKISFVLNLGFGTFVFVSNFEFIKNKSSKKENLLFHQLVYENYVAMVQGSGVNKAKKWLSVSELSHSGCMTAAH